MLTFRAMRTRDLVLLLTGTVVSVLWRVVLGYDEAPWQPIQYDYYHIDLGELGANQDQEFASRSSKLPNPSDAIVDVINNLGVKLLAIHNERNENNIAISPYGAFSVLAALTEGLQGDSVHEILHAVHIPYDQQMVRVGLRDIHRHLKSYFIPEEGFLAGLTLNLNNISLKNDYQEVLKFYGFDYGSFNNALYPDPPTTKKSTEGSTLETGLGVSEDTSTSAATTTEPPGTTPVDIASREDIPTTTEVLPVTTSIATTPTPEAEEVTTTTVSPTEDGTTTISSTTSTPEEAVEPATTEGEVEPVATEEEAKPATTETPQETTTVVVEALEINAATKTSPGTTTKSKDSTSARVTSVTSSTGAKIPGGFTSTRKFATTAEVYRTTSSDSETASSNTGTPSVVTMMSTLSSSAGETTGNTVRTTREVTDSSSIESSSGEVVSLASTQSTIETTTEIQQSSTATPQTTSAQQETSIEQQSTTPKETTSVQQSTAAPPETTTVEQSTTSSLATSTGQSTTTPQEATKVQQITATPQETTKVQSTTILLEATNMQQSTATSQEASVEQQSSPEAPETTMMPQSTTSAQETTTVQQSTTTPPTANSQVPATSPITVISSTIDATLPSETTTQTSSTSTASETSILTEVSTPQQLISVSTPQTDLTTENFITSEESTGTTTFPVTTVSRIVEENSNLETTTPFFSGITANNQDTPANEENFDFNYNTYNDNSAVPSVYDDPNIVEDQEATESSDNNSFKRSVRSVGDYIISRVYDDHPQFVPLSQRTQYVPEDSMTFAVYGKYREPIAFMKYDTVLPYFFAPSLNAVALSFPLDSSKYYLLLLLPLRDDGIDQLIRDLRVAGNLKYIIENLRLTHVQATIPSFTLKGYVTLTPTLQKLGIRQIFEPRQADFTPMTNASDIFVTNIEQAVTVTIRNYLDPSAQRYKNIQQYPAVTFKADHPFLYFVVDSELHVALMVGKVINPLNSRIS